jgi:DAK2 domain fusion protein YloV
MATALDAAAFRRAMEAFEEALRIHRDEINSLNVYPVADGDTGTNLLLTQEAVVSALASSAEITDLSELGRTVAMASLMGARGNSGVILSQALRGLCESLPKEGGLGPADLAVGLDRAAGQAYGAVARPVEGTVLSVLRDAARGAARTADAGGGVLAVIEAALEAARGSLARTTSELPQLHRAGVVDAGGKGAVLLFDALRAAVAGDAVCEPIGAFGPVGVRDNGRIWSEGDALEHPFEVQYLLEAGEESLAALRPMLEGLGGSLVVVGGGGLYNVHVHTALPDRVVEAGRGAGEVRDVTVASLQEQVACLAGEARAVQVALPTCALVAVAEGEGLSRTFASLGALVLLGGPGNNPSVQDLLSAMRASNAEGVIVLPNHRNVIPAAQRAAAEVGGMARVVPAASIPAGIAAAAAFNPRASIEANEAAGREAVSLCRSGELVRAERDAETPVGPVRREDWLAFAADDLIRVGGEAAEAAVDIVRRLTWEGAEIVTVVVGAEASPADRDAVHEALRRSFPDVQVDLLDGGQPRYPFLIGVE